MLPVYTILGSHRNALQEKMHGSVCRVSNASSDDLDDVVLVPEVTGRLPGNALEEATARDLVKQLREKVIGMLKALLKELVEK
jgi:ATP-dependent protease Clp ATPase subunit